MITIPKFRTASKQNIRTFALPFESQPYTFKMNFEYDSWNRMQQMIYPDGEVVNYGYNCGGLLSCISGEMVRRISDVLQPASLQGNAVQTNGGDGAFSFGAGLGFSVGFSSDPYFIIESISISTAEEATLKSEFCHWTVVSQKYNKTTNTFQGFLKAGNTTTNIKVSCSSVNVNGKPKPDRIWTSAGYLDK